MLLKRIMLKTLYMLNFNYLNDDYEFILNKNEMKKLNEKIKHEGLLLKKHGEDNPTFIKLKKDIDLYLKYDHFSDEFLKESKELYSTFDDEDLEIFYR